MPCPLCGKRQPRRACPALGRPICAVCCGTKRMVEIACPPTCVYLASSKAHPPAVVRRQQGHDVALLAPVARGLTDTQMRLLWLVMAQIIRQRADTLVPVRDEDVAEGIAALVATLDTSERGVIYEHRPSTLPAQRVVSTLNGLFAGLARESGRPVERDAGTVLRRVGQLAEAVRTASPGAPSAFLDLAARLSRMAVAASGGSPGLAPEPDRAPPSIILP